MGAPGRAMRGTGALLLAAAVAVLVSACNPRPEPASAIPPLAGTEPNGEQKRTGGQLLADARAALRSSVDLDLTGTLALGGREPALDLDVRSDGTLSGTVTVGGGSLQVQLTGVALYVRPTGTPATVVRVLGLPAVVAKTAPDSAFWQLPVNESPVLTGLAQPTLATTLLPVGLQASPGLASTDVDGVPVVTATAGTVTAYVAVTGDTRLVRLSDGTGGDLRLDTVTSTPPPPLVTPAAVPTP